jgi:hypothetical protein
MYARKITIVSPRYRDTGKVARARIIPPTQKSLFEDEDPGQDVARILAPGARIERRGRIWHIGGTTLEDGFLYGKLGFEGSEKTELWNEESKDFEDARTPAGVASPFAIYLANLRLAFQVRGQDIHVGSFISAMRDILRSASGEEWSVEAATSQMTFTQWRSTVDKVNRLHFYIEPPNPNYQGRPYLERLIAEANLSSAEIDLNSDAGIQTDTDIVNELFDHVDRGYGQDRATGERVINGTVVETVYSSQLNGETELTVRPANPETGEVERQTLRLELIEFTEPGHAG